MILNNDLKDIPNSTCNEEAFNKFIDENLSKDIFDDRRRTHLKQQDSSSYPKRMDEFNPVKTTGTSTNTHKEFLPSSRIDELVNFLSGMKLFVKLDVRWGYHNIAYAKKMSGSSFICKRGVFEPTVMFFGLNKFAEYLSTNDGYDLCSANRTRMLKSIWTTFSS